MWLGCINLTMKSFLESRVADDGFQFFYMHMTAQFYISLLNDVCVPLEVNFGAVPVLKRECGELV